MVVVSSGRSTVHLVTLYDVLHPHQPDGIEEIDQSILSTSSISTTKQTHTTIGCGEQGFPSAQPYLSHTPGGWLLMVLNFLAPADIICFSLCSRTLKYSTTGLYHLTPVRDRSLALSVLTRLARDIPQRFCCHYCAKLHRITDVHHPASARNHDPQCPDLGVLYRNCLLPSLRWLVMAHCLPSLYDFHHWHLVAVLQNHHGGSGINPKSLAYTEVVDYPREPARTTLSSVEGRVCTPGVHQMPSFVLQIQQWILFHDRNIVSDGHLNVPDTVLELQCICREQTLGTKAIVDEIQSAIRQQGFGSKKPSTTEYMRCSPCRVEFQIALRDCGKDGTAVVVTKWLDLGAGTETDLEDLKWKQPTFLGLEFIYEPAYAMASSGEVHRLFRKGSECDPTLRNQSYLIGRRYRRAMGRKPTTIFFFFLPLFSRNLGQLSTVPAAREPGYVAPSRAGEPGVEGAIRRDDW
ncbi:hypothetical protein BO80DRAFT_435585 [Aspergillus ibericus CBS 121593]|uniref:F-box domain-containing protein n=1 Tax=Aspergillus ibericus CBS 121593 TaxID=1448316 RepID=A0A395H1Y4_9EURO|nr:hypothetical protein BO80DRAFT_435585 [Aspergillus ibericus CBS 121593]RAL00214.1 hypothetical protein BO80DRAFT_435585 [Aspergillus ibericus CBS 121593]